jgi:ABC-type transport system involved in multi-copper enzyme maturation permease subunit
MTSTLDHRVEPRLPLIPRQRLTTLTGVEIRKMVDTRSGLAVLGTALAIAVLALGWKLLHVNDSPPSWSDYSGFLPAVGMAVAMIGLFGMTAEWTQRTALTTFTLSPRRGRVLAAKFAASVVLALAALAVVFLLILGAVALGGLISGQATDYSGLGRGISGYLVISVLEVTMAAGFGALSAQTAVAVGGYIVGPAHRAAHAPNRRGSTSSAPSTDWHPTTQEASWPRA